MAIFGICSHVEGTEICIGTPGHRGRHKLRDINMAATELGVPTGAMASAIAAMTKEEPMPAETVTTKSGRVITEAEIEAIHSKIDEELPVARADPSAWAPGEDDFISLKGKLYLPARRRVQWMRGNDVKPHPDWTIDTMTEEFERGKFIRAGRVEGGFAVVRANIFDTDGRLISTGVKSEYSENFADFLEKAETGAIARALAIAGYGTEAAVDLDEGLDKERIADSPIAAKPTLGPSAVPGVGRGGRTDNASAPQIRRVAELSRTLDLGVGGLMAIVEQVIGTAPILPADEAAANKATATFLSEQSGEAVGRLIATLEAALPKEEPA